MRNSTDKRDRIRALYDHSGVGGERPHRGDLLCYGAEGVDRRPTIITPDMRAWHSLTRWIVALQRRRNTNDAPGYYRVTAECLISPTEPQAIAQTYEPLTAGLKEASIEAMLERLLACIIPAGQSLQLLTAEEEEWLRNLRAGS